MKYPENHKTEVHLQLNQSAAKQIRQQGIDGISVAKVMASQSLTKGGFYAHYASKEALIIEAIQAAFDDVNNAFYKLIQNRPDAHWINTVIKGYLSEYHRDEIASSCPVATLSADMPRQSKEVKKVFEQELKKLLTTYQEKLEGLEIEDAENKAIALFSLLLGGLQLARSTNDSKYSDQILDACITNAKLLIKIYSEKS